MKKKKGQAMVEVALVLPIIAFLLCGITDFGRILFAANNINMVSQEAVRYASFKKSDGTFKTSEDVKTFAIGKCSLSNKETKLDVDTTYESKPSESEVYARVDTSYNVDYITPLMQDLIGSSFTVKASSTIRVE